MPYKYIIELSFKEQKNEIVLNNLSSGYPGCGAKKDFFVIHYNSVQIEAYRSTAYKDGTILSNSRNSLYHQIIKGLLIYYALSLNFPLLEKVVIKRIRKRLPDFVYTETINIEQPLKSSIPRTFSFSKVNVGVMLEESPKGTTIRYALAHWLKASASNDHLFKFERLWRAYDILLLYQGNTKKEIDGIRAIKTLIKNNTIIFANSLSITNSYTQQELRKFSWNKLFADVSCNYTKPDEVNRRFLEYKDKRIMQLFKGILNSPKINTLLNSSGQIANIRQHFISNMNTNNDIDLVLLLSLSYTYKLRCKIFHGAMIDNSFRLKETDIDNEIKKLVKILESVVFELIENCHILR